MTGSDDIREDILRRRQLAIPSWGDLTTADFDFDDPKGFSSFTIGVGRIQIRPRLSDDLDHLARVAREVHKADGYPRYNPEDDLIGFLEPPESIAAWVAVLDGDIVGQVSLHSASSTEVMALAVSELGVAVDKLGVVARLMVDPSSRGVGTGRILLETAEQGAVARGLVPILDVIERFVSAIALYERLGWRHLGSVRITMPDLTTINEHVYVAPPS